MITATHFRRGLYLPIFVLLVTLLTNLVVQAQGGYPEPEELYVNDFADLLTSEDTNNVRNLFVDLKQTHGIEATVVTVNSISDFDTGDSTIEAFATNLFNTWGIGNRERNDGVLLLVAVGDRKVRIEVGSGHGAAQNDEMQEVINEHIIPSFRNGNFSQGIYRGARAIVGKLTGDWPPDLTGETSSSNSSNSSGSSSGSSNIPVRSNFIEASYNSVVNDLADVNPLFYLGGGVGVVGAAGLGVRRYLRYRKRRCPDCQTYMVRLDEVSDDVYLDSGQKLEELLNSIDYDVWRCPECNYHTLHGYSNWFSGKKRCPRCNYRTVEVASSTLVRATTTSSGKRLVTKDCRNCDYHHKETVIIPKKTESSSSSSSSFGSSSSGSSFGGGSSSGGGASGSW